ncbi:MAG TPA: hypothetical protein VM010_01530 [Chitinophagaceae bacterium]|nr:hypothetical protein [Chitinophagaceae bacterium]
MKTIFFLLSLVTFTTTFAQTSDRDEAKRVILGERRDADTRKEYPADNRTVYGDRNDRYPDTYGTKRNREMNETNRDYDQKIASIRSNRTLSRNEKERIIYLLESDRRNRIDACNNRAYKNNNRDYDNNRDHGKKYKKSKFNNGNHYGWYNGK